MKTKTKKADLSASPAPQQEEKEILRAPTTEPDSIADPRGDDQARSEVSYCLTCGEFALYGEAYCPAHLPSATKTYHLMQESSSQSTPTDHDYALNKKLEADYGPPRKPDSGLD